jgi:hypothetical protein
MLILIPYGSRSGAMPFKPPGSRRAASESDSHRWIPALPGDHQFKERSADALQRRDIGTVHALPALRPDRQSSDYLPLLIHLLKIFKRERQREDLSSVIGDGMYSRTFVFGRRVIYSATKFATKAKSQNLGSFRWYHNAAANSFFCGPLNVGFNG